MKWSGATRTGSKQSVSAKSPSHSIERRRHSNGSESLPKADIPYPAESLHAATKFDGLYSSGAALLVKDPATGFLATIRISIQDEISDGFTSAERWRAGVN